MATLIQVETELPEDLNYAIYLCPFFVCGFKGKCYIAA